MNQIKNHRSFIIESYYANYIEDTSVITITFDVDQPYLDSVNRIAVTKIYIPNTIWQYDPTDYIILLEGEQEKQINFPYAIFKSFESMCTFMSELLTNNSPNNFIYNVTLNSSIHQNTATMICSDNTLQKKILVPTDKHILVGFGLKTENVFENNNTLVTSFLELTPINLIYVNTNLVNSYNTTGLKSSSILSTFNLKADYDQRPSDLLSSAKVFNHLKKGSFALTDFDGEIVPLNGHHWYMELSLFYFDEDFGDKFKLYLDIMTMNLLEKRQLKKLQQKEEEEEREDVKADLE